jgi:hypothetical protein
MTLIIIRPTAKERISTLETHRQTVSDRTNQGSSISGRRSEEYRRFGWYEEKAVALSRLESPQRAGVTARANLDRLSIPTKGNSLTISVLLKTRTCRNQHSLRMPLNHLAAGVRISSGTPSDQFQSYSLPVKFSPKNLLCVGGFAATPAPRTIVFSERTSRLDVRGSAHRFGGPFPPDLEGKQRRIRHIGGPNR